MKQRVLTPYGISVSAVLLMVVLKAAIEAWTGPGPPLMYFVPVVTFVAWLGGLGPGLLATVMSGLISSVFFLEPVGSPWIESKNDLFLLILFLVDGALTSVLMERLHVARRQSEASTREAERYRDTLQLSEQRLQALMDNATAAIYLKDAEGRYLLANRRCADSSGSAGQSVAGKTDYDLFSRDLADRFRAHDRRVLDSGRAMEWEDDVDLADGIHTYMTIKFPICNAAGVPHAVGGFSTDITERKRAETALRESEERFRSLSACSPLGIFLTDVAGLTTYTNPRCQEIFGFDPEEALGEGWSRFIHPDDRDRVLEHWSACARGGHAFALEYRVPGPRGDVRWIRDRTAPVISARGELVGHVGTVEDITEHKRAEEELRRERDFAEHLIEMAQAIVLVLDRDGRVVRCNPFLERITHRRQDEVWGMDWFATFVPGRDRGRARAAFETALVEAEGGHVVHPVLAADDREREVDWTHRALDGGEHGTPGVLLIGHDITELREAQRRALQAERLAAVGQMVTGLAHESRNALQRGQACLEMLGRRLVDRREALDLVSGAQEALDDLHCLYEEVRCYAAPVLLDRRECCLRDTLREAWANLGPARISREVRLDERGLPDPSCAADHFRLVQVFRNILDNALAACHDPVEITVEWSAVHLDGQAAVRVAVQDNGPGLTAEQRRNLFEPFYTTKTQGTGLGLAIARRIVEAHGGCIEAGPDNGRGATILITLPRGRT
jgi:PAS domain S-box-containing protein